VTVPPKDLSEKGKQNFSFFPPSLQSYSSTAKERRVIEANANSLPKLLGTGRLRSSPKLSSSWTNGLQHQMSSWRTSPEGQPGFSSQARSLVKPTVLSFGEAHGFKAAQQHKTHEQKNLAAVAFSQFPAPWCPRPGVPKQGNSHQYRHTTATSKDVNASQEARLPLPSAEPAPTELNLGTHLLKGARAAAPVPTWEF